MLMLVNVSVKLAPDNATGLVFVRVKVMVDAPPMPIIAGENAVALVRRASAVPAAVSPDVVVKTAVDVTRKTAVFT